MNLKLLWWLRNLAIIGQVAAVLVATHILAIPLQTKPLWLIISSLVVMNIFTLWRIKTATRIGEYEFFIQLLIDISALALLLYLTGGATNPFTSLFILQVIIAAIILTPLYTWIIALLAIAFYTALMFHNIPVEHLDHHHMSDFFSLHVEGMWISFMLLALIVAWFVTRMNNTIRRQNALLAEAEKLAAIGTLAASAAHELGTPLATLSILAEDQPPIFKEQLARCKQIISRITAAGGLMRAESGAAVMLADFLCNITKSWQQDHPNTQLLADIKGPDLRIIGEYNLEQAIRNLLDNAADASPEKIEVTAKWNPQILTLIVQDHGPGLAKDLAIGEIGITTKEDGLGLGLFLARSVISRLGGRLELRSNNGTIAIVTLPLKRLSI